MKIHILRHVPFIYYGHIKSWVEDWGAELVESRLFQGGALSKDVDSDLLIIMGGTMSIHDENEHPWLIEEKKLIEKYLESGHKILGICLGAQLLAHVMGAKVEKARHKEIGWYAVQKTAQAKNNSFLDLIPDEFHSFQWHGDGFEIPPGAEQIFTNENNPNQGFIYKDQVIGVQFHPEMDEASIESLIWRNKNELANNHSTIQSADQIRSGYSHQDQNRDIMHALIETLIKK